MYDLKTIIMKDTNIYYLNEYSKEPKPFSTTKQVEYISESDIQQVRDWKNKVIEIRDSKKGTPMYVFWDLEAKRILEFLNQFSE